MTSFVLDCSVALCWCFLDEQDAYAVEVLRSMEDAKAVVPCLWPLEVTNGLLMGERRNRSTEADTTRWLGSFASLPIEVDARTPQQIFAAVTPMARAHRLTSYDAAYLEIAVRRSLALATMESRLKAVADEIGVKLYQPKIPRKRK